MAAPQKLGSKIQSYLEQLYAEEDPALISARNPPESLNIKGIPITPLIGKTLFILSRILGAKRILEIGTLAGYSTIWLARSLPPDGTLITLEIAQNHVVEAKKNIAAAGLNDTVHILQGPAKQLLKELKEDPFDLIFLDADKEGYPDYLEPMIALLRPYGLIIADNLIRRGKVINPSPIDSSAQALNRFNKMISCHPRLESVILPTLVGHAGGDFDGLSVSRLVC